MQERLQKYVARCGIASRRKAEQMIAGGRIMVNGKIITDRVFIIDTENDTVLVDGIEISTPEKFTYYAVYKPRGFISTIEDPHAKKRVIDLVPSEPRVFPVGRLDKDSEGLMILTNDGDLALRVTHPRYEHEKEYLATVKMKSTIKGQDFEKFVKKLSHGVDLNNERLKAALVELVEVKNNDAVIRFILKEGRKRHIRRMCSAAGLEVKKLLRIRVCRLELGELKPGEYIKVKKHDII